MKIVTTLFTLLLLFSSGAWAAAQETIDIEVTGMTCPFCVYGTEKNLGKLPGVEKAVVSLDKKMARITMAPGQHADLDAINKAIVDAGFTPGTSSVEQVDPAQ